MNSPVGIFGSEREQSLEKQLDSDRFVLLKGRRPEGKDEMPLSEAIGLNRLAPWLNSPNSTLYLLSPDEEENVALLKYLATDPSVKAKILCYSHRVNSYTSLIASSTKARLPDLSTVWPTIRPGILRMWSFFTAMKPT